jgi:KAP family P-loop domain
MQFIHTSYNVLWDDNKKSLKGLAMTQEVGTTIPAQTVTPALELRLPDSVITPGEWPSPQDKLGRCEEIENLSSVLLNAQAPLVFALEAPWGGGKSTFIKLWEQYLTSKGQVCLTLNAWESDFCDDPLLPMLSTLDGWLAAQNDEGDVGKAWEKAKDLAPSILKTTVVAGVKLGTLGALDLEKAAEGAIASASGEVTGNIVDSFNSKMDALKEFKKLLSKALAALPDDQPNLIIFVDELDRCRPSYAIEVLERIKHLFDIERVIFVLAVNREQLGKSLQGVYGPAFDGEHYLKRFIDLDYQLQVPDLDAYIEVQLNQPDLVAYFTKDRNAQVELDWIRKTFCWLCDRFDYQLRDVNQLITRFRLILRSIPSNHQLRPQVLCSMLFLREHNPELYRDYSQDISHTNEVLDFLLGHALERRDFPDAFRVVAGVLLGAVDKNDDKSGQLKYWSDKRDSLDQQDELWNKLDNILRIAEGESSWDLGHSMETTYKRIELMQKIVIAGSG